MAQFFFTQSTFLNCFLRSIFSHSKSVAKIILSPEMEITLKRIQVTASVYRNILNLNAVLWYGNLEVVYNDLGLEEVKNLGAKLLTDHSAKMNPWTVKGEIRYY